MIVGWLHILTYSQAVQINSKINSEIKQQQRTDANVGSICVSGCCLFVGFHSLQLASLLRVISKMNQIKRTIQFQLDWAIDGVGCPLAYGCDCMSVRTRPPFGSNRVLYGNVKCARKPMWAKLWRTLSRELFTHAMATGVMCVLNNFNVNLKKLNLYLQQHTDVVMINWFVFPIHTHTKKRLILLIR